MEKKTNIEALAAEKKPEVGTEKDGLPATPADAGKEPAPKKKGGRPKMTPEQKAAAKKLRAEAKAKVSSIKVTSFVQYAGVELRTDELIEKAKAAFKAEHKRTAIEQLNLYIKPEDNAAYYVVNERFAGKIDF